MARLWEFPEKQGPHDRPKNTRLLGTPQKRPPNLYKQQCAECLAIDGIRNICLRSSSGSLYQISLMVYSFIGRQVLRSASPALRVACN